MVRVSFVHYNTCELSAFLLFPLETTSGANVALVEEVNRLIGIFDEIFGEA